MRPEKRCTASVCSVVSVAEKPRRAACRWRSSRNSAAIPFAEKADQIVEASARQRDVLREQLGTRDDARLAEGGSRIACAA
jgi:hypothetical protein